MNDFVDVPIRKLVKLRDRAAVGDGCEADSAAVRLRELLDRYGLDESYLLGAEAVEVVLDAEADFHRVRLAEALAKSRACRAGVRADAGLVLRGPRRFAADAEAVYKRVVKEARCHESFADAPQAVDVAFKKVFWATFIDCVVLRLVPERSACGEVLDAGTAARKRYDFSQGIRDERAAVAAARADMVDALFLEVGDPYRAAAEVHERAVSRAQALASRVALGEPPTWEVLSRERSAPAAFVRGLLGAGLAKMRKRVPARTKPALFEAQGRSDDCASITGVDDDEYRVGRGTWYDFEVDGAVVGQCRMRYDGEWMFQIRAAEGHAVVAKKRRRVRSR